MKNFHQTPGTATGELPEGGRISRISDCAKARYIDLKSDFGFKKIFGKAVNKDFLIHFLNTLLWEHPERTISENNAYLVSTDSLHNDKIHEDVMTDRLHFVYLELARFRPGEAELKADLDKWCFALKGMQDLLDRPVAFQKEIFRCLFAVAEVEGRAEGVKTGVLQTARAMLAHGVDKATVAACTGLSSEEVESL